jgi:hypothetical protein
MKLLKGIQLFGLLSVLFVAGCKKDEDPAPVNPGTSTTPAVSSTSPASGATSVSRNKVVTVTFSEAMDSSTVVNASTFTLKQGTSPVLGTVVYSGTTASFTPTVSLVAGTSYTATMTTAAKSKAGIAITRDTVFSFTTGGTTSTSGLTAIDLGSAANYVILAETAITNVQNSSITGDVAISPYFLSDMTGFSPTLAGTYATSTQVVGGGKIYSADMTAPTPITLTTALNYMLTAYNDGAGRPSPDFTELYTGALGGKTLVPGLYKWTNTVSASSDFTISGGANDVFIFQIAGDLTLASAVNVTLVGVQAKNIFWVVAGQVTLGTTSHFEGVILSSTAINFLTGATMNGQALAQSQVVLDQNTIVKPL